MCFREEADEYIDIGALNGIFVLGRSMGFIGKLVVRVLFGFGLFVCSFYPMVQVYHLPMWPVSFSFSGCPAQLPRS